MGNKVVLVIRRSKDYWLYNTICNYKLNLHVCPIIGIWDSFFNLKIMDFRNQLRDIASSTYLNNKFDQIFLHSYIDPNKMENKLCDMFNLYNDDIIVPMDEDDWIDPSLAEILRNIETDKKFFVWNYYKTIKEYEFESFKDGRGRGWTMPCSWAIKSYNSFLKRHNHLKINEEEFPDIYFIKQPLAIKVEHVGSIGFLKKVIKKNWEKKDEWMDVIVKKIIEDLTITGEKFPIVFQEQWEKYRELLKELLASAKYLTEDSKENL